MWKSVAAESVDKLNDMTGESVQFSQQNPRQCVALTETNHTLCYFLSIHRFTRFFYNESVVDVTVIALLVFVGSILFGSNLLDWNSLLLLLLATVFRNDVQTVEEEVENGSGEGSDAQNTERRPRPIPFHQETSNETTGSAT